MWVWVYSYTPCLPSAPPMPDLRQPAWKPCMFCEVLAVDVSLAELISWRRRALATLTVLRV